VHLLDLEHRAVHQQPLQRQRPLVVGQQRTAHLAELRERAALERHRVHHQRIGQRVGIIVGVAAAFVAHLGQQVVPAAQQRVLEGGAR
jgi:phage tail sheath gpL-like